MLFSSKNERETEIIMKCADCVLKQSGAFVRSHIHVMYIYQTDTHTKNVGKTFKDCTAHTHTHSILIRENELLFIFNGIIQIECMRHKRAREPHSQLMYACWNWQWSRNCRRRSKWMYSKPFAKKIHRLTLSPCICRQMILIRSILRLILYNCYCCIR